MQTLDQWYRLIWWLDFSIFLLLPFLALALMFLVGSAVYVGAKGSFRLWLAALAILFISLSGAAVVVRMILAAADLILHAGAPVSEKAWFGIPLLLLPMILAVKQSLLPLWKITQQQIRHRRSKLQAEQLRDLVSPRYVLPVYALGMGIVFNHFLTVQHLGLPLNFRNVTAVYVLYITLVAVFWLWQRRRSVKSLSGMNQIMRLIAAAAITSLGIGAYFSVGSQISLLPEHLSMVDDSNLDDGGGPRAEGAVRTASVAEFTGPRTGEADRHIRIVAEKKMMQLDSGERFEAWTYNGQLPGPEIRLREGELVEITLTNKDIDEGVTIHWHGLNVPNAEDGVPGLTQDAVMPGQSHTYRFRVEQVGSYWYHSHQQSSEQVHRGLFGPLVIEPKDGPSDVLDLNVVKHTWELAEDVMIPAFGTYTGLQYKTVLPGTKVRLRTINADSYQADFSLIGVSARLAAMDGAEVHQPEAVPNAAWRIGGGGRYDVMFTMPDRPVLLQGEGSTGILFRPADDADVLPDKREPITLINPLTYGGKTDNPFDVDRPFDRKFQLVLGSKFGFYNGEFNLLYTINDRVFPDTPSLLVREGELVKITLINRTGEPHPMHTHGHRMLVLSRNGEPAAGSPWLVDTLNVLPGEMYEVALLADNPGIWMDHCHNLNHAAVGMTMHLVYEGVTSPYVMRH